MFEMNAKVIIVTILLALGAGGYFMTQKTSNSALNSKKVVKTSSFASIQDALSKSLSLECAFTDEKGKKTKTYIKSGAVRSDFTGAKAEDSGSMIMKDKKLYTWTNANKEGFMMTVPEVTPGQTNIPGSATGDANRSQQATDVLTALDKFKDSCKPGTVADSLFTPPSDIKFTDFSNMMKQFAKPTGGSMKEESVKDLMEKYDKDQ